MIQRTTPGLPQAPLHHIASELGSVPVWSAVSCCIRAWASPGVVRCTMLYPSLGQSRCGPLYHAASELGPTPVWSFVYHAASELWPAPVWSAVLYCIQAWAGSGVVLCAMLHREALVTAIPPAP